MLVSQASHLKACCWDTLQDKTADYLRLSQNTVAPEQYSSPISQKSCRWLWMEPISPALPQFCNIFPPPRERTPDFSITSTFPHLQRDSPKPIFIRAAFYKSTRWKGGDVEGTLKWPSGPRVPKWLLALEACKVDTLLRSQTAGMRKSEKEIYRKQHKKRTSKLWPISFGQVSFCQ